MRTRLLSTAIVALGSWLACSGPATADEYQVDNMHSAVSFKISHMNCGLVHGRFNKISGTFNVEDADPTKTSFTITLQTDSVDTNQQARDKHLRSGDFFNAEQFPTIAFQSNSVKAADGNFEVIGDLTMHGVTKPVTVTLKRGGSAEFPRGKQRTGFYGDFTVKRSDFGVGAGKFSGMLGDEIPVSVSFEGVKK
jgi:polyisoprenoid-binding protein YceI